VDTKLGADYLSRKFSFARVHEHLPYASLHGDKTQTQRNNIVTDFKNDELTVIIATDVASRGLDVKDIEVVVNYDMPHSIESYIHRIGRTGRAGKPGLSITYFTPKDQPIARELKDILQRAGQPIPPELIPMSNTYRPDPNRYGRERVR